MSLAILTSQYPDFYEAESQQKFGIHNLGTNVVPGQSVWPGGQQFQSGCMMFRPQVSSVASFGSTTSQFEFSDNYCHAATVTPGMLDSYSLSWHPQKATLRHFPVLTPFFQMPSLLAQTADDAAFRMLLAEPGMMEHATTLYESGRREMARIGLSTDWQLSAFTDPEGNGRSTLVLQCKVHGMKYEELLTIWDELSLKLFHDMPLEVQKHIALTLDEI